MLRIICCYKFKKQDNVLLFKNFNYILCISIVVLEIRSFFILKN